MSFAPGIPENKIHPIPEFREPKKWELSVQFHQAEKAGPHYDLRVADPDTGHAHSWALKELPKPGEVQTAIMQPTHDISYMDFKGVLPEGYGKGTVTLHKRGPAEVLSANDNHIKFNFYSGKGQEEYLLRRIDGEGWILRNMTKTRERLPGLPDSKPKYRSKDPEELDVDSSDKLLQAKLDGAHVLLNLDKSNKLVRAFSYRPTDRDTGVIEHTHRLPEYHQHKVPAGLGGTVLRAELYATDDAGRALPPQTVGGILNASVWKSRQKQEDQGKLKPVAFDVVRYKGRDVEGVPYEKKLEILQRVTKENPWISLPRMARTPEEKAALISDIRSGKEPSTIEGVVEWDLKEGKPPTKYKFRPEVDVYVKKIFMEKSKRGLAGGFEASTSPDGPVAFRVGTGFDHQLKKEMAENPGKFEGLHARVKVIPGHEGRSPAFISWHLDQELPMDYEQVKHAAFVDEFQKIAGRAWLKQLRAGHITPQDLVSRRTYPADYGFEDMAEVAASALAKQPGKVQKGSEEHGALRQAIDYFKDYGIDLLASRQPAKIYKPNNIDHITSTRKHEIVRDALQTFPMFGSGYQAGQRREQARSLLDRNRLEADFKVERETTKRFHEKELQRRSEDWDRLFDSSMANEERLRALYQRANDDYINLQKDMHRASMTHADELGALKKDSDKAQADLRKSRLQWAGGMGLGGLLSGAIGWQALRNHFDQKKQEQDK